MASSHKKLVDMARRWRRRARGDGEADAPSKGRIVLYAADGQRFVVPVSYLGSNIFRELLDKAEEVFGLPVGPIRLPCDARFLERVVACHRQGTSKDVEKALLRTIRCTSPAPSGPPHPHQLLCGF